MTYQRILLATDLGDHSAPVLQRAQHLASLDNAELILLHVVESLPLSDAGYGSIVPLEIDLTEQLIDAARQRMSKVGGEAGIPAQRCLVELGSPKLEIIRVAEEMDVDLIIVGSHGRHGIGLLLGSTASSVVHHARCDVLAVRLKD